MKNTLAAINFDKYGAERKKNTKVFAHFCSYTPEEIIHAAGILPVRILGADTTEKANTHLQSYCCSYAKRSLEHGLISQYDGAVFIHSCDTMQRLSDIWDEAVSGEFHDTIVFPIAVDKGLEYLVKELLRFKTNLERYAGEISEDDLRRSVEVYNENRKLLQKLYEKRKEGHIPASTVDKIVKASMVMLKQDHTAQLEEFLEEISLEEPPRPRLLISGSVLLDTEILDIVEECGSIGFDDLCIGSRYFNPVEEPTIEGIAKRYQNMWCPCRASPSPRADYLIEKCREYALEGAVLLLQKFCEPHFFEVVATRNQLKEHGYPCLLLELEDQPSLEQIRTRVQAFCEMLEG